MRRAALLVLILVAMVAGSVWAQTYASQLSFLDTLPGLSATAKTDTATASTRTYKVTGSPDEVFAAIMKQLRGGGWNIGSSANIGMVRSLQASKGNVHFNASLAASLLSVSISAQGTANTTTSTASGGTVVNESSVSRTIPCNHANLTINGSSNRLTLTGTIEALTINGNANAVQVDAQVGHITLNGTNNTVRWSKGRNVSAPGISTNGSNNQVVEGN